MCACQVVFSLPGWESTWGVAAKVPRRTLFPFPGTTESLAFNALRVTRVARLDDVERMEDGSLMEPSLISAATNEMRLRIVCTSWNLTSVGNQSNNSKCNLPCPNNPKEWCTGRVEAPPESSVMLTTSNLYMYMYIYIYT